MSKTTRMFYFFPVDKNKYNYNGIDYYRIVRETLAEIDSDYNSSSHVTVPYNLIVWYHITKKKLTKNVTDYDMQGQRFAPILINVPDYVHVSLSLLLDDTLVMTKELPHVGNPTEFDGGAVLNRICDHNYCSTYNEFQNLQEAKK